MRGDERIRTAEQALAEGLLREDHSEIREVPDGAREVWTRGAPRVPYSSEDYSRDKAAREKRRGAP